MSPIDGRTAETLSNLRSIHLLRALLRETSYLPDAASRKYFHGHIISRFKAQQPITKAVEVRWWEKQENGRQKYHRRRSLSVIEQRTIQQQRKGRKALSVLRRANIGYLPCLEKVLLHTYGRMGRRRYQLLDDLLKPDALADAPTVEATMKPGDHLMSPLQRLYYSEQRFLSYFDAPEKVSGSEIQIRISDRFPRLKEVLSSQSNTQPGDENIKNRLIAPSKNVWERPMPIRRARNIVRRFYKDTMQKLLPPLPDHEWDRLKGLSTGTIKWEGLVPRRSSGLEPSEGFRSHIYVQKSKLQAGLLLKMPSLIERPVGKDRPHNFTPRLMRRLYSNVLAQSCKLNWDPVRKRWRAEWGTKDDWKPKIMPSAINDALFAGVDEQGKRSRSDQ